MKNTLSSMWDLLNKIVPFCPVSKPELYTEIQAALDAGVPEDARETINPAHQVFFRAGLLAARESLACLVEKTHPEVAESIRANWWPQLGDDPGKPRKLLFSEIATGGEEGPWGANTELSPSVEALPESLAFLELMKA